MDKSGLGCWPHSIDVDTICEGIPDNQEAHRVFFFQDVETSFESHLLALATCLGFRRQILSASFLEKKVQGYKIPAVNVRDSGQSHWVMDGKALWSVPSLSSRLAHVTWYLKHQRFFLYNGNTNVYLIGSLKALTAIGRVNQWASSSNKHSYRFVGDLLHLRHCAQPPQGLKTHDYLPFSLFHFSPSSSSLFFFPSPKLEILWWVCSFVLSFNKHLLSSDYVPGVVLGSEDTSLTETMFMFSWRL